MRVTKGTPLAITETGLSGVPEPPDEFRRLTWRWLQEADDNARDEAGLPRRALSRIGVRHKQHRSNGFSSCVGCGCDLDDASPGCHNCASRHAMRAYLARKKAEREAREAEREAREAAREAA